MGLQPGTIPAEAPAPDRKRIDMPEPTEAPEPVETPSQEPVPA